MTECKKCKKETNSGLKCVVCNSFYHKSCAERLKKVKLLNDTSVNCCDISSAGETIGIEINSVDEDNVQIMRLEILHLKELLRYKDVIIDEKTAVIEAMRQEIT